VGGLPRAVRRRRTVPLRRLRQRRRDVRAGGTRFTTYGVALEGTARAYADAILALPPMREWFAAAKAEHWTITETDAA
jgi:hypothetical protein